jgi:hydrogenase nickel incorporation protein HypA/HybF
MHEMALCAGLLETIEAQCRMEQASRVHAVYLEIGALAAVDAAALRSCFEVVSHGTVAQGARVEISTPPGEGWCPQCACTVAITSRLEPCPQCESYPVIVKQGAQMRLVALDVT